MDGTVRESGIGDLMRFRYSWRPYQERIFQELPSYLENQRVHIVAAPGSGKTVIGLEIVRRLDRPTLILAPTLTIRDQWVDRLCNLFLPPGTPKPDWISTDLAHPAQLTVVTYQALYCASSGTPADDEDEEVLDDEAPPEPAPAFHVDLQALKVGTLVVDEAHHLHAKWWKALMALYKGLEQPIIVSLTATPAV